MYGMDSEVAKEKFKEYVKHMENKSTVAQPR